MAIGHNLRKLTATLSLYTSENLAVFSKYLKKYMKINFSTKIYNNQVHLIYLKA